MQTLKELFNRPRAWAVVFVVVLLAGPAWIAFSRPEEVVIPPAPRKGAPAPEFQATTLGGQPLALSDFVGRPVVLNLWATWCPPCRAEMPSLERVAQRYAEDGLVILALNQGESAELVQEFVDEHDLTFTVALDPQERVGRAYELMAYPTTFFIGRDGVIKEVVSGGPMAEALIENQVKRLVD